MRRTVKLQVSLKAFSTVLVGESEPIDSDDFSTDACPLGAGGLFSSWRLVLLEPGS